jgi:hypothetical protein
MPYSVTEMLYHIISNDEDQNDDEDIQAKDIEKFKELTKQSTGSQQETGNSKPIICLTRD